jgi:hypothetical protein
MSERTTKLTYEEFSSTLPGSIIPRYDDFILYFRGNKMNWSRRTPEFRALEKEMPELEDRLSTGVTAADHQRGQDERYAHLNEDLFTAYSFMYDTGASNNKLGIYEPPKEE